MTRDWRGIPLEKIVERWNAFYPARYQTDLELFSLNTVDSPLMDWGVSLVKLDDDGGVLGFVCFKKPATRYFKVNDPDSVHLNCIAFSSPSIAIDLLSEAKKILRERGVTRIVFGTDSKHFFPGVPIDVPALNDLLMVEGFEFGGEQVDLERDLSTYELPKPLPEGVEFRPLTPGDHDSLVAFFDDEFPGRWKYDVLWKVEKEGRYDFVYGLIHERRVRGFALLQDASHRFPIGGAVWRNNLGEKWGSLGPIGVSQKTRGQGWGGALLGAALQHLANSGAKQSIIDWTTLVEFYGKHGFEPTRTYRSAKLDL